MKLSSKTHYGLMACHILARNYGANPVSASELEKKVNVSGKYLEKIMRMLSARSIVGASRGANGGYFLVKNPSEVTIGDIIRTFEDDMEIIQCVSKDSPCKCCPSAMVFKKIYNGINEIIDNMTLKQMLDGEI